MSLGIQRLSSETMRVGLGTWQSDKGLVRAAVAVAIKAGYRHIDAAWIYQNENEVGEGIADAGIPRSELYVTSKLWNTFHSPEAVEGTLRETLKRLGLDYLDLYLMHWPVAQIKDAEGKTSLDLALTMDHLPTWKAMEKMVALGLVKDIGVSNFTIAKLEKLMEGATIKPAVNQVELNLRCAQPELLAWAKKNNVLLEAYSPLGSTGATQRDDEVVVAIAKAHGVDPANILISWQVARGVVCLPKSVTPSRIIANLPQVKLSAAEVAQLEARAVELGEKRTVDPSKPWGFDIFESGKTKL